MDAVSFIRTNFWTSLIWVKNLSRIFVVRNDFLYINYQANYLINLNLDFTAMDEDWDDAGGNTAAAAAPADAGVTIMAEMPEIKLFGKWSCDDVEVVDMSLQVRYSG